MRLYVMRHGPAEDRAASGRDADRRLTPAGRSVVWRVASAFEAARAAIPGPAAPLRILSSPRARAHETAKLVQAALVPPPGAIEIRDDLGGETAIPRSLIAEALASGIDTLLVGHQPVVEELVRSIARDHLALPGFRTAMIVELTPSAAGETWELGSILDPERLPG